MQYDIALTNKAIQVPPELTIVFEAADAVIKRRRNRHTDSLRDLQYGSLASMKMYKELLRL